jgi:uncharacterized protein YukE
VIGFAALREAKLGSLDAAVQVWTTLGRNLATVGDGLEGMHTRGLAGWQGEDADAARAQIKTLDDKTTAAAEMVPGVGKVLASAHQQFKRAQDSLEQAISNAENLKIKVGDDGSLRAPEPTAEQRQDPHHAQAVQYQLNDITTQFTSALRMANEADQEIAGALSIRSLE